jgi:tetratricopeptide (TPR) repeat protein
MNEQLCAWLDDELGLPTLAGALRDIIRTRGTVENFVTTILKSSNIYTDSEMIVIQNVLEKLKSQKSIERQKYKGDNLLESGETEGAILIYQGILGESNDENVGAKFYAEIYASLGAAYGRLFLYQEAAKMYDRAYQMCGDVKLLKPYLYASYKYMSMPEYAILLTKNTIFAEINTQMRKEMEEIKANMQIEISEELMEKWKRQYRRSHV